MKTIIVDGEPLLAEQLEENCSGLDTIEVVGSFRNPKRALEYAEENTVEFAFLEVEMPEMNGLELGKRLKEIYPEIVLIYVTGYSGYAVDVLKMKADYCIMKPVDAFDIADATQRAELLSKRQKKRITVHMLGRFDVFINEQVIYFHNAKSKELLALCMDRCGGNVSMEEAIDKLWPERTYDDKVKRLYRKAVMSLRRTLREKKIEMLFFARRGFCYISKKEVECDYFTYLEDPIKNRWMFKGEYLFDYSWGEETLASLMNDY